jgi:DNA-binding CsgD family transcriptional regulator
MELPKLTNTEYTVAENVTKGFLEKQIADMMHISPSTVHNHTYSIRKKWDCRNAVDICRKFILQLDNPKKYFATVVFLAIQFQMIFATADFEIRRARRIRVKVKTVRTYKPKK